ncbi:MAG: hypothetical protein GTO23_11255, partial [Nitrososphaeria archaeon]|nr:hypothetical protein [Nitrososphaeria archaeon]
MGMNERLLPLALVILILSTLILVVGCQPEPKPPIPPPTPSKTLPPRPKLSEAETITFPDENLESAVRNTLDKPAGEEITVAELDKLTTLYVENSGITNLSGLDYCTNLTELGLSGNQISDI